MKSSKSLVLTLTLLLTPALAAAQDLAQLVINPTVLEPSTRTLLPQGGMMMIVPPGRVSRWDAVPCCPRHPPVRVYRYKPFMHTRNY